MRHAILTIVLSGLAFSAEPTPREALAPFGALVGMWRGSGIPEGALRARTDGAWSETISVGWQFGPQTSIRFRVESGKHITGGEILPAAKAGSFRLKIAWIDGTTREFDATLKDKTLTAIREDKAADKTQKIVLSMLHANRFVWRLEEKPISATVFVRIWQVGATRQGESIAEKPDPEKECIVSGGVGSIAVTHKGKTYYVCCSGCRDEFKAEPETYVRERATKKK